ncbi:MAG: hypothetical protein M3475_05310 [Actinomycetota bacterium]|nr:hypothetical protein [Actinomycetota bacterium]
MVVALGGFATLSGRDGRGGHGNSHVGARPPRGLTPVGFLAEAHDVYEFSPRSVSVIPLLS